MVKRAFDINMYISSKKTPWHTDECGICYDTKHSWVILNCKHKLCECCFDEIKNESMGKQRKSTKILRKGRDNVIIKCPYCREGCWDFEVERDMNLHKYYKDQQDSKLKQYIKKVFNDKEEIFDAFEIYKNINRMNIQKNTLIEIAKEEYNLNYFMGLKLVDIDIKVSYPKEKIVENIQKRIFELGKKYRKLDYCDEVN